MTFSLARPSLAGDLLGPGVKGFMTGMMLLSGLILLARAPIWAASLPRALLIVQGSGSAPRAWIEPQAHSTGVFTEAVLISLVGGAVGLVGSIVLLRQLSMWHPVPQFPIYVPVNPDAKVYLVALLLALPVDFSLARCQ